MKQITKYLHMEKLDLSQAKEQTAKYDYVIAHMMSELQYGPAEEVQINWEELLELRAFDEEGELHVFGSPEDLQAVRVCEVDRGGDYLVKSYRMRDQKILKVREYLAVDEDGQAVTVYTRPFAVTEDTEYGRN